MKDLDREWKGVGFSGKDNEDRLWSLFQAAKSSFWDGKRVDAAQRQQEWRDRMQDVLVRKRGQILDLQRQIDDLQYKMSRMSNQEYISNMLQWIGEKEEIIRGLEADIWDIERKL